MEIGDDPQFKILFNAFREIKVIRIIIPFYNEGENVARVFGSIRDALGSKKFIIYAVNDGSKDKTLKILEENKGKYRMVIINHPKNLGVASAFRSGLELVNEEAESGDAILIMEGDGTSEARLILKIVEKIKSGVDIVIASRYVAGGGYRAFPLLRLILSKMANLILSVRFPYPGVQDYTIFYRGYSQKIIKKGLRKYKNNFIQSKYFTANSEILTKFFRFKPKVEEIPFIYDYSLKRGASGLAIKKNLWQYLKLILSIV
jgi:dolichol-phosphate mannosyltransferase